MAQLKDSGFQFNSDIGVRDQPNEFTKSKDKKDQRILF